MSSAGGPVAFAPALSHPGRRSGPVWMGVACEPAFAFRLLSFWPAVKRAEHRSESEAKRRTCLSIASCAPTPDSRGAQGDDAASLHRLASQRRVLWLLSCTGKKVTRPSRSRGESSCSKALAWLLFMRSGKASNSNKGFHSRCAGASHLSLLVQRKVAQIKHGPDAIRRASPAGSLRSSHVDGTAHNSLRSDMCASTPLYLLRCSARSTAMKVKSQKAQATKILHRLPATSTDTPAEIAA